MAVRLFGLGLLIRLRDDRGSHKLMEVVRRWTLVSCERH